MAMSKGSHVQRVPTVSLNSILRPWPFRGWAMDLIGHIFPPSLKAHSYLLVVEAIPSKVFTQTQVIEFLKKNVIHRFCLSYSIIVDQGTMFNGDEIRGFAIEHGIQILNSSPYYAQANGQAEATNKIIKNTLKRVIEDNPRDWHNLLSEVLWAYRNSRRNSTGTTLYELVYGHDVVLPLQIIVRSNRLAQQLDTLMDE
ncbi:uncharacterized protein LOC114258060 [Camellia sinensis]|uniref:uncharacterized protein LOC114258060 n=1 Tax=Camellia sinensis TaxID=4442 RepID=UPI00103571C3|nr:uncharacterized protein LOC114258060 [Camellia sinensis]